MHTPIPNGLDGIARHRHAVSQAVERGGVVSDKAARAERVARIAQASNAGVSPGQAFHRDPAYRRQLSDLIDLAAQARHGAGL